jgi:AraC-like DNA-binding protein
MSGQRKIWGAWVMARMFFRDPDELRQAIDLWGIETRLIALKPFRAELTRRRFGYVASLKGTVSPSICHVAGHPAATTTFIFFDEAAPPIVRNGVEITAQEMFVWPAPVDYCARADHVYGYHTLTIPNDELAQFFPEPFTAAERVRPSPLSLSHLRYAHRMALASDEDAVIARAFQDSILHALAECLITAGRQGKFKGTNRALAMLRFQSQLENTDIWPKSLEDICGTIGVVERSLRRYCDDYLGMSPHDYMVTYRLGKVRQMLLRTHPATASIADLAARYGFLDPSRFARLYREVYDETPSATLHASLKITQP